MRRAFLPIIFKNLITALTMLFISSLAAAQFEPFPKTVPAPKDNPTTKEKVELGKKLYFDPRLSADGSISCNSCHNVFLSGEDNRAGSVGVRGQIGGRTSPTVFNSAFYSVFFWDGRAGSLEEQAKGPLTNPVEMGMKDHDAVMARVKEIPGYEEEFKRAFPGKNPVLTIDHLAKAIAAFERTLVAGNSAFDQYLKGNKKALSPQAKKGMDLVVSTGCISCHSGAQFSGPALPAGQGFYQKFPTFTEGNLYVEKYALAKDLGRFEATKKDDDKNFWRVPTWRNVAITAPYFHNGKVASLAEAVRVMAKSQLNKDLPEADVSAIVAFLESLTDRPVLATPPKLPAVSGRSIIP